MNWIRSYLFAWKDQNIQSIINDKGIKNRMISMAKMCIEIIFYWYYVIQYQTLKITLPLFVCYSHRNIVFYHNWKSENTWWKVSFKHKTALFLLSFVFVIDILLTDSTFAAITVLRVLHWFRLSLFLERSVIHHSNTSFIDVF